MCVSRDFEADTCSAAGMWADTMFRAGVEPFCRIHHCALLQVLRRPGDAAFTESLVAHLNILAGSWFT